MVSFGGIFCSIFCEEDSPLFNFVLKNLLFYKQTINCLFESNFAINFLLLFVVLDTNVIKGKICQLLSRKNLFFFTV